MIMAALNPFDIRQALLAKHAQHVVLIHFPIALFMAGAAFDFLAHWTKRPTFAAAAYYNLAAAALFTVPVIATGLLAWQLQLEGQKLEGILLEHLVLGIASGVLICLMWWFHVRARRAGIDRIPELRLATEAAVGVVVAATAHLGGFLSGVNLPG